MNKSENNASKFMPNDEASRKVLRERAISYSTTFETNESIDVGVPYIKFRLGANELYGVEFKCARGVIQVSNMKKLPCVSAVVCGVINYQGKLIGVLDLEKILGLKSEGSTSHSPQNIIIASLNNVLVGILVGKVEMSDSFKAEDLSDSVFYEADHRTGFIKGIDKGMISIVNLDAILASIQITEGTV